jgi:hypothetical protein
MPRSVRFATHTEGRYISYPTKEDNVAKSYCEEDYMHFKNSVIRDSLRYSHKIYGSRDRNEPLDSKSSKQLIIRCVGIDHLISRDVQERYHAIRAARKSHARLVLDLQTWQMINNAECPMDLAQVAMSDSQAARNHSVRVAKKMALIK